MEGRTIIPWDKDDLDALGILKVSAIKSITALLREFPATLSHPVSSCEDRLQERLGCLSGYNHVNCVLMGF